MSSPFISKDPPYFTRIITFHLVLTDFWKTGRSLVFRCFLEESGFQAKAERMLAVFDRAKHGHQPPFPFHVYKLFILCRLEGGEARLSMETTGAEFFAENEIPPLSISRVTPEQIHFCFESLNDSAASCRFD